jgi:hypothetical protein
MKTSFNYVKAVVLIAILITLICTMVANVKAQTYNLAVGTNVSKYIFKNSDGNQLDFLKSGSGSRFQIGTEFQLLDTSLFLNSTSKIAIFFSQRQRLAQILTRLHADIQVESNQINAVGDVQNVIFSYQTNFVGLSGGLGYQSPEFKGWSITPQSRMAVYKLIQGNQALGSRYLDLSKDKQFSKIQVFLGYAVQIQKKMNDKLSAFLDVQNMQTLHPVRLGAPSLNFQNTTISFGLKILK